MEIGVGELVEGCLDSSPLARTPLMLCPDHGVSPKPTRRRSPVCKSKKPLFLHKFADSVSPCVQCIEVVGEPQAQLRFGFCSSKGGGKGFLRFSTPDWLTFHQECPGEKRWVYAGR